MLIPPLPNLQERFIESTTRIRGLLLAVSFPSLLLLLRLLRLVACLARHSHDFLVGLLLPLIQRFRSFRCFVIVFIIIFSLPVLVLTLDPPEGGIGGGGHTGCYDHGHPSRLLSLFLSSFLLLPFPSGLSDFLHYIGNNFRLLSYTTNHASYSNLGGLRTRSFHVESDSSRLACSGGFFR